MRQNMSLIKGQLKPSMLLLSAAKGLELGSSKRMSQVMAEEVDSHFQAGIGVLSGPNLSREIAQGLPAATVVAAEDGTLVERVHELLLTPNFGVFTSTDVVGVEIGGALKNIIALGAGIADGLGFGDNAKAVLITRGLAEITSLGIALGANPITFSGLSGLGDLLATCSSTLSRNHYVGAELAKGSPLEVIRSNMHSVAEGVDTTIASYNLAQQHGVKMPITEKIYQVLFEGLDPLRAVTELMRGS
jgi:glycerol-3-phosphate dehydrogenase (NAD(P)+)